MKIRQGCNNLGHCQLLGTMPMVGHHQITRLMLIRFISSQITPQSQIHQQCLCKMEDREGRVTLSIGAWVTTKRVCLLLTSILIVNSLQTHLIFQYLTETMVETIPLSQIMLAPKYSARKPSWISIKAHKSRSTTRALTEWQRKWKHKGTCNNGMVLIITQLRIHLPTSTRIPIFKRRGLMLKITLLGIIRITIILRLFYPRTIVTSIIHRITHHQWMSSDLM